MSAVLAQHNDVQLESEKLSEAYTEGKQAYRENLMYEFAPYTEGSFERNAWENGWLDAEAEVVASPL